MIPEEVRLIREATRLKGSSGFSLLISFPDSQHPFASSSLIFFVFFSKLFVEQPLLKARDIVVEKEYHHKKSQRKNRGSGNHQTEVKQETRRIKRMSHVPEGSARNHLRATLLTTDCTMARQRKINCCDKSDAQKEHPNIERDVIRYKGWCLQEKCLNARLPNCSAHRGRTTPFISAARL